MNNNQEMQDTYAKYEECLKRLNKAFEFMDNPEIPYEKKEKHMDEFFKVVNNCSILYNTLLKGGWHVPF